jgi:hypothetical protein
VSPEGRCLGVIYPKVSRSNATAENAVKRSDRQFNLEGVLETLTTPRQ